MRDNTADYRDIFLNDLPMMDMRAPVEFTKGAFPNAISLPLMTDIERQKVGTCYKQKGQQAAIELGHQLVSGKVKAERVEAWAAFARANPNGYLYCFRGGLRSQIVQQWLKDAGIDYPRVIGGYKAMRTFLIETLDSAVAECDFVIVGGMTGTGKTEVIAALDHSIDLEGHANHRGSSFGKRATGQPAQIDFENRLAIDLLKRRARGQQQFVLEDESRLIGTCSLPLSLHQGMQDYPLVWLEDQSADRVGWCVGCADGSSCEPGCWHESETGQLSAHACHGPECRWCYWNGCCGWHHAGYAQVIHKEYWLLLCCGTAGVFYWGYRWVLDRYPDTHYN